MFRVPINPEFPSFDETEKIGFARWLFSTRAERKEWIRLRTDAAKRAQRNQEAARMAKKGQHRTSSPECGICGETDGLVWEAGWLCVECHRDEEAS